MISARFIMMSGLICLGVAALGATLLFWGDIGWARYLALGGVGLGALTVLIGGVAALSGQLEDDLRGSGRDR